MKNKRFCIDTCSLVVFIRYYPQDLFESLWKKFEDGVENGTLVSSKAVYDELKHRDDDVVQWAKSREKFFIPVDQIAEEMPTIMTQCPNLIDPNKTSDEADPYIIATAKNLNGTVVTQETPKGKGSPRMKIPNACEKLNIPCLNILGMLRELEWRF